MKKLRFRMFLICLAVVLSFAGSLFAQQPTSISPEKKALIQELRELTEFSKFTVNQKISTSNVGDVLFPLISKDKELSDDEKRELKKLADEGKARIDKKINDFSEDTTIPARIFEEICFQMFDKEFTEAELKEMVVFYRTPTGQKSAKFMSMFISRWSDAFSEALKQKFADLLKTVVEEEVKILRQKIDEVKSRKLEAKRPGESVESEYSL